MSRAFGARRIVTAAAAAVLLLAALAVRPEPRTLWMLPLVACVLIGLHHYSRWSTWARAPFLAFLAGLIVYFGSPVARTIRFNLRVFPPWDYLGFWLHARSAALGHDFYDPAVTRTLASGFLVDPEFTREIVDVGFWYPPPSMFLFWPLGWFDPLAALPLWYAFHFVVAIMAIVLLWKTFVPAPWAPGLLACAALMGAIHGTETTFRFSQTNFVALVAVLMFWRRRDTLAGGAWAAIAFFIKPFLLALTLAPILGARRRALAGIAIAALALMAASAAAFGLDTFLHYFIRDHVVGKPDWIYDQPTNQSLLGLILRVTRSGCAGFGCIANPIYLGAAAVLVALTLFVGIRLQRAGEDDWAISLYLVLALILYPVSQLFYSVLLLPPALAFWMRREQVPGGADTVTTILPMVWALAALKDGTYTIWASLLLWSALALFGALRLARTRRGPAAAAAREAEAEAAAPAGAS